MPTDHAAQIRNAEEEITALSDALAKLGKGEDLRELIKIMRFPGYTTPAEMLFTLGMIRTISAQTKGLIQAKADLLAAAKQVSTAK